MFLLEESKSNLVELLDSIHTAVTMLSGLMDFARWASLGIATVFGIVILISLGIPRRSPPAFRPPTVRKLP